MFCFSKNHAQKKERAEASSFCTNSLVSQNLVGKLLNKTLQLIKGGNQLACSFYGISR